jgi:hypothetical protein
VAIERNLSRETEEGIKKQERGSDCVLKFRPSVKEEVVRESARAYRVVESGRRFRRPSCVTNIRILDCNFRHVLNVVYSLLGDTPASKFYVLKLRHIKFRSRGITQKKEYNIRIVTNLDI